VKDFRKMWEPIAKFNRALDVGEVHGNLVAFLKKYERELDEFVAEFEIVPGQIGAVVLIGGQIVGVELAPSRAYFESVWEALVRVSYGSLAIQVAKSNKELPFTRLPFVAPSSTGDRATDLAALRRTLEDLAVHEQGVVWSVMSALRSTTLTEAAADESLGDAEIVTVASAGLSGQIVRTKEKVAYASLCVSAA
jgi:hypothetical protein